MIMHGSAPKGIKTNIPPKPLKSDDIFANKPDAYIPQPHE
jgi:hypothetical protein